MTSWDGNCGSDAGAPRALSGLVETDLSMPTRRLSSAVSPPGKPSSAVLVPSSSQPSTGAVKPLGTLVSTAETVLNTFQLDAIPIPSWVKT